MVSHHPLLLTLCACLLLASCRDSGKPSAPAIAKAGATRFVTDSIHLVEQGSHGLCEVYIDYPVSGPAEAVAAVREFVKSILFEDGGQSKPDDAGKLARAYCDECQEAHRKTLEQMGLGHVEVGEAPEEGVELRLVCNTPLFITYEVYRYSYITHGGHGEYSNYGVTFRLRDGHRFGDDIIATMDDELYSHILDGMRAYFGVKSDAAMQALCTADLKTRPLPTLPPCLVADGVRYHYSIYDICPFEEGDPAVTIPWAIARPYMTAAAREMIPTN